MNETTGVRTMKNILFIVFVITLFFSQILFASGDNKNVTVTARGMGADQNSALKDALSQAIMQAAGAIVDSQTLVQNDEIIQEKVLTASNAIVKKYDIVMPAKQRANGLWEVKIKAVVQQNLLRQTLVKHNIIKGSVEGTQNLWAEIVTEEKNQVDMNVMIENTIKKINFNKYLQFSLIGVNGTRGNNTRLYVKPKSGNNRIIQVSAGLVCNFDSERFQRECMPHLKKIFDSLPFARKEEFTNQTQTDWLNFVLPSHAAWNRPKTQAPTPVEKARLQQQGHEIAATWRVTPLYTWNGASVIKRNCRIQDGRTKIFLNISPKYRPGTQRFICYMYSGQNTLWNVIKNKQAELKQLTVSLCFLDKDGNEVKRVTQKFDDRYEDISIGCRQISGGGIISPEFFKGHGRSSDTTSSPVMILPLKLEIDLDDFKDIKSFKLEINGLDRDGVK